MGYKGGPLVSLSRVVDLLMICIVPSLVLIISFSPMIFGLEYDEDILLGFDEYWMAQELGPDGNVTGPLPIHWYARDPDGLTLLIDFYIKATDGFEWVQILKDGENSGTYVWDLKEPSVKDGDYVIKVQARNHNGYYCSNTSTFSFHVHNPKAPDVTLMTFLDDLECSGKVEIKWDVQDLDHSRYLISSRVLISPNDGGTFQQVFFYREDPGWCILDTRDLMDGDNYRLRVEVEDPDGLKDSDVSGRFYVYNNVRPEVNLTFPLEGTGIYGSVTIEWDSFDRNDGRDDLRVDLWYVTVHDGGMYNIVEGAHNNGSYKWDTAGVVKGPKGHRICIQLTDPVGERSEVDEVFVWIYLKDDRLIVNPVYPRGTVMDNITLTWETYKPALAISEQLLLTVYHTKPGSGSAEIYGPMPDLGTYSIDVSSGPDGIHKVRMTLMDPLRTWIHDELVVDNIEVYHGKEPQMFVRDAPANGTNMTGIMIFDVAGFDGNGDILTYMGLYAPKGGGWTVFDIAYGGYRHKLVLNTTDVPPGEYEVRIVVYDGSDYNMSTSSRFGPYHLMENRTPALPLGSVHHDGTPSSMLILLVLLTLVLISVILIWGLIVWRSKKTSNGRYRVPIQPPPLPIRTGPGNVPKGVATERLLPPIGATSPPRSMTDTEDHSTGGEEGEMAFPEEYLNMFDPYLLDDISTSDLGSYDILGVGSDATSKDINTAYREFIREFHPDRFNSRSALMYRKAEEEVRKRNRARAILLDPGKRAILDRMLRESEEMLIRNASVRSLDQLKKLGRET
ncbi:MAG: DnaJ domain-containing protein [Candidatus Thermoplasmatota archaeon]|nr:DnaJ domain-containing protein [Candidatus Thermoplasmatota archaeon]